VREDSIPSGEIACIQVLAERVFPAPSPAV